MTSLLTHILTDVAASLCEAFPAYFHLASSASRRDAATVTPRKFSRHGAVRVDFPEDSLLRFECHDRRANERARSRRIQRLRRFAPAAISRELGAEARLARREALRQRN